MKNVCITGYGAIGPVHAAAISKTENAKLYAVCDIDKSRIESCQSEWGDIKGYTDFDEMLLDKDIDSVHICTPHYLHFEMIKKALAKGKTVVSEKPITMTNDEFTELLKTENSDKVCCVLQNRLNACVVKLKEIVKSGKYGKIITVKSVVTWHRDSDYYAQASWRGKKSTEGGGVLINQSVHTLDLMSYVIGDIKNVKAHMTNFSVDNIEVEDTFAAYLGFKDGINGIFFATNAYGINSDPNMEIVFENGIARYEYGKLFVNDELVEENSKPTLGKAYWGSGHENLMRNYYDRNEYFAPKDVENTMRTMFAMYDSAENAGEIRKCE